MTPIHQGYPRFSIPKACKFVVCSMLLSCFKQASATVNNSERDKLELFYTCMKDINRVYPIDTGSLQITHITLYECARAIPNEAYPTRYAPTLNSTMARLESTLAPILPLLETRAASIKRWVAFMWHTK